MKTSKLQEVRKSAVSAFLLVLIILTDTIYGSLLPDNLNSFVTTVDTNELIHSEFVFNDPDILLERQIRSLLLRNSTFSWAAKNIKVIVNEDEVLLTGAVQSSFEKKLILNEIQKLAPSSSLIHNLRIESVKR